MVNKNNRLCLYMAILMLLVCLLSNGCLARNKIDTSDIREAFLTVYFTYNFDDRYERWTKNLNQAVNDKTGKKLLEAQYEYYDYIREYVSEDLYELLIAGNAIRDYEEYAYENGISYYPSGFDFEEYSKVDDKTTYTYIVDLVVIGAEGAEESGVVKGQITVQQNGDESLISNFYLSPVESIYGNP